MQDPDENRIAQWIDVKPLHGIVDLSFPLASDAALGTYTIEMEDKELSSKADGEFTVEEYGDISKQDHISCCSWGTFKTLYTKFLFTHTYILFSASQVIVGAFQ